MGSPAIFSGKFTKLLTQLGLMLSNGAVINNDGEKNYIGYATFENGLTTGWSLGTTGTLTNGIPTGTPTFGSGASGTLALTAQSTGPLSGSYSLQLADSAATTAGNMVATSALAIDLEGQARVLTWEFYYKCSANASNGNFSGTSSNTFGVAAYDVTNSVWLPLTGNFNIIQNSGVGYATGTVQTGATTASIRYVVYCANASSGAITMLFDDFYFGPITAPTGSAMTDWQSYTPTVVGFGTVSITESQWRREGDSLFIRGKLTTGTSTGTTASLSLPSGLVIDPLKVTSIGDVGKYIFASTAFADYSLLASPSGTALNFGYSNGSVANLSALLGNQINVNNTAMSYSAGPIPIQGWSSNVIMSNDTDTRVISFRGTNASQAATALVTNLSFTTVKDTAGAWNGTQYQVPVAGDYLVSTVNAQGVVNGFSAFYLNGTVYDYTSFQPSSAQTNSGATLMTGLKPGDLISVRSGTTSTLTICTLSIFRLSGPATIAATESVNASYYASASATANTTTQINYDTKVYDSHNAVTTGAGVWKFTAPISGKYRFSTFINFSPVSATSFNIGKNGTTPYRLISYGSNPSGQPPFGAVEVQLNAGDTIAVYPSQSGTYSGGALSGVICTIDISRIGN